MEHDLVAFLDATEVEGTVAAIGKEEILPAAHGAVVDAQNRRSGIREVGIGVEAVEFQDGMAVERVDRGGVGLPPSLLALRIAAPVLGIKLAEQEVELCRFLGAAWRRLPDIFAHREEVGIEPRVGSVPTVVAYYRLPPSFPEVLRQLLRHCQVIGTVDLVRAAKKQEHGAAAGTKRIMNDEFLGLAVVDLQSTGIEANGLAPAVALADGPDALAVDVQESYGGDTVSVAIEVVVPGTLHDRVAAVHERDPGARFGLCYLHAVGTGLVQLRSDGPVADESGQQCQLLRR